MKKTFCLLLTLLFFLNLTAEVLSFTPQIIKKKKQLEQINTQLQYEHKRLKIANEREKDISYQLGIARNKLRQTEDRINKISGQISTTELEIKITKQKLQNLREKYARHQWLLSQRLYQIYRNGQTNFLAVILNCKTFGELLNRIYYLRLILQQDIEILKDLKQNKEETSRQKLLIDNKYQELVKLKNKIKQDQILYSSLTSRREKLLREVQYERYLYSQNISELEHLSKELEAQLQELIRREQERLRKLRKTKKYLGRFISPCDSGYITSPFGWRKHPIDGVLKFHTGIDIAADYGDPIYAAGDGTVIYSGWYNGYGYAIIIDHGGGVSTLYAHCSVLYKELGQTVKVGEVIARVGSTGRSTGPHLHFEIRENGIPVDPQGRI